MVSGAIEVFDNESTEIPAVSVGEERVVFDSRSSAPYDYPSLAERLQQTRGLERIRYVQVKSGANLRNCEFLRHFSNVEGLTLSGKKLQSLEGISFAARLQNVILNAGKKNQIDLVAIETSSATTLRIEGARSEDLDHVRASKTIRHLEVVAGELRGLVDLRDMRLEELVLVQGHQSEINDAAAVPTLHSLWLTACKELKGFSGEAPQLKSLTLEASNAFDPGSIRLAKNLEVLRILACKRPFRLSDLSALERVEDITITNSALQREPEELSGFGSLRKLWISPSSDDFIREVSSRCSLAKVCNGKTLYVNGMRQSNMQDFYE